MINFVSFFALHPIFSSRVFLLPFAICPFVQCLLTCTFPILVRSPFSLLFSPISAFIHVPPPLYTQSPSTHSLFYRALLPSLSFLSLFLRKSKPALRFTFTRLFVRYSRGKQRFDQWKKLKSSRNVNPVTGSFRRRSIGTREITRIQRRIVDLPNESSRRLKVSTIKVYALYLDIIERTNVRRNVYRREFISIFKIVSEIDATLVGLDQMKTFLRR